MVLGVEVVKQDELERERKHGPCDLEDEIIFRDEGQGSVIPEWKWWSFGLEAI